MTEGYCYAAESREFYKFGHSHDPSRRVRAIVGREARLISTREVEAIRQLAEQKTALIAGRRK